MKAVNPSPGVSVHLERLALFADSVRARSVSDHARHEGGAGFEPAKRLHLEWTDMVGWPANCTECSCLVVMRNLPFGSPRKMLRGPLPGADAQTTDALGEVCNRIAGSCKHKVNGDLANVAR
jgi:hypothetical protein